MAGFIVAQPSQVLALAPGVAMLGPNTRVKTASGFVATMVDTVMLGNNGTGHWIAPDTRTQVGGVFTVSQSGQGLAVVPGVPSPVALLVVAGTR